MKIMCVSNRRFLESEEDSPEISIGTFYEVVGEFNDEGELYYILTISSMWGYNSRNFALLTDADPMEEIPIGKKLQTT